MAHNEWYTDNGMPKYRQLAEEFKRKIRAEHAVGDSMGNVMTLAAIYGCSTGTVLRANRWLAAEGWLSPIRSGVPTRIIAIPPEGPEPSRELQALRKARAYLDQLIGDLERD
jgi:DNA-binding transcriptional MocR family regulator